MSDVSQASLILQKRFLDVVSSKHRPCITSTSCARSNIATTKQKIISKLRKKFVAFKNGVCVWGGGGGASEFYRRQTSTLDLGSVPSTK